MWKKAKGIAVTDHDDQLWWVRWEHHILLSKASYTQALPMGFDDTNHRFLGTVSDQQAGISHHVFLWSISLVCMSLQAQSIVLPKQIGTKQKHAVSPNLLIMSATWQPPPHTFFPKKTPSQFLLSGSLSDTATSLHDFLFPPSCSDIFCRVHCFHSVF